MLRLLHILALALVKVCTIFSHYLLPPACISNLKVPSFQLESTAVFDIVNATALALARVSTLSVEVVTRKWT